LHTIALPFETGWSSVIYDDVDCSSEGATRIFRGTYFNRLYLGEKIAEI